MSWPIFPRLAILHADFGGGSTGRNARISSWTGAWGPFFRFMVIKLWYDVGWDSGNDQPWDFGLSCSPKLVHACAVWRFTKPIAVPGFESSKAPGVIQISSPLALEAYSDFNLTVQCSAQQLSWIWVQVKRGLKGCKKSDTSYERNETQFSKLSWSQKQADLWDPMSIWVGLSTEFGTPSIPRWKRVTFAEVIDTFDGWALLSGLEAQT